MRKRNWKQYSRLNTKFPYLSHAKAPRLNDLKRPNINLNFGFNDLEAS